ncbi:uncharacterized protein si:ch211-248a14.8 isoform X2 [Gadus macrocephalus]|uniref:uncharacterized protein si:ch211-248a14.8 isoform X2 n=1 Tax=Gadus macrocephalus TaxID=80720 RepID=UPI0028CB7B9D|nr:uncharacterized protein si:ch211-248a14.8 isoform X2 [Gadus macrocephalus]
MSRKGCWCWRWCLPMLQSLPVYPSAKATTVPVLWVPLLVIYVLADKLQRFVAGIFIPQYHYPYVVALCFAQVVLSLLVLNLLHLLRLVSLKRCSRALGGERLLVPAVCGGAQAVMALWARANSSVDGGLFPLAACLLPLVTAGWSHTLRLAAPPSARVTGLVGALSGMSLVVTGSQATLSGTHPLEYLYAPLSLILQGLALAWLAKVSEAQRHHPHNQQQASSLDLYYTHLVHQSWVLGLLWLLHPDGPWWALTEGSWCCLLFHGYLLALLLLGAGLQCAVYLTAQRWSPLAAALLSTGPELTGPLLSFYLY